MNNFEKLNAPSLKEMFVNKIAGLILSGKLHVGEKFPSERTLAEQMGVGKTVVHSGLQELQRMGLVVIKPQSGVYVADYMLDGNLETFNAIVRFNGDNLSVETISGLFDLRIAMEGLAMRRLADRHTDDDIALLRRCVDRLRELSRTKDFSHTEFAEEMYKFPKLLCRLSGCDMLALVFKSVEPGVIGLSERYAETVGSARVVYELECIVDAIENGDGDAAVSALAGCMDSLLHRYADMRKQ